MPHELFVYDEIGPGWLGLIDGKVMVDALAEIKGQDAVVRINSPGGDVHEAIAILEAMRRHDARLDVRIDSLAASAASLVAMGVANGGDIRIAKNAYLMIHEPYTITIGDAAEHESAAVRLRKVIETVLDIYQEQAGDNATRDQLRELMTKDSYLTADESLALGLVDGIGEELQIAANVSPALKNVPPQILGETVDPLPADQRQAQAKARLRSAKSRLQKAKIDLRRPPNLTRICK